MRAFTKSNYSISFLPYTLNEYVLYEETYSQYNIMPLHTFNNTGNIDIIFKIIPRIVLYVLPGKESSTG